MDSKIYLLIWGWRMSNVLILMAIDESENELSGKGMEHMNGVFRAPIYYACHNPFVRIIRKIWRDLNLPGYQIWFDKWWDNIQEYDTVIAIAYKSTYKLFKILKKKYPYIRRIMYWWDPVMKTISPDEVEDSICEKWTFSQRDAKRYNLKYNATFLPVEENVCKKEESLYDIMFVGSVDKLYCNRVPILCDVYEFCENNEITTSFHVLYHSKEKYRPFEMKKSMGEREYYELVGQSNALLDIVEPGNEWMTLRPLEALYFKKKLISNNVDLEKEPLYHPDNVFILGKDNIEELPEFLHAPLSEMDDSVYDYYRFSAWLHRFGLNI